MAKNVSLEKAVATVIRSQLVDTHVAFTAKVISYDISTQTATLEPVVSKTVFSPDLIDNADQQVTLPRLFNVPIRHPRGGENFIHVPIQANDYVHVHVNDIDEDNWRSTGQKSNPSIPIPHSINSVWAEPGAFYSDIPLAAGKVNADNLTVGKGTNVTTWTDTEVEFGSASDYAALASRVEELEQALNSFITTKYNVHVHGGVTVGTGTTGKAIGFEGSTTSIDFASDTIKTS